MKLILSLLIVGFSITGCLFQRKVKYKLYVVGGPSPVTGQGEGYRELVADFYESIEAEDDCEILRKKWNTTSPLGRTGAYCEKQSN